MERASAVATWAVVAGLVIVAVLQGAAAPNALSTEADARETALGVGTPGDGPDRAIQPISAPTGLDPRRVALGRRLFSDPRLSGDNTISCESCHVLDNGGVDGRRRSLGIRGQLGNINAPTVLNAGFNFRQFWDGRAATLEEQAGGPVLNPLEMGASWEVVLPRLRADGAFATQFAAAYRDGISAANVQNALATFERSLATPDSKFDRYLRGETGILTDEEIAGHRIFTNIGCVTCHQGVNVGGNSFQRMGQMRDYFADRGNITDVDRGRYNVTHDEADRYAFKVPSLRNVALTAPYFHDGSAATLEDAIRVMAQYQLGQQLPARQVTSVASFLRTLTGVRR